MSGPVVVKVGGAALEQGGDTLWSAIARASRVAPLVVVHGGGAVADARLSAHGFTSDRIAGLRLTPREHLGVVVGALAGEVNTGVVATLNRAGAKAVGLTLVDGAEIECVAMGLAPDDRVGRVVAEHDGSAGAPRAPLYTALLSNGFVPVVASIGTDDDGLLNINADDAAEGLAAALHARALVLLSDVPGVLDREGRLIASVEPPDIDALVSSGVVTGGMEAKVRAAARAADRLGSPVVIASWREPAVLDDVVSGRLGSTGVGTVVSPGAGLAL